MMRLVRDARTVQTALGDGNKRVYDSELDARAKLRRAQPSATPATPVTGSS